MKYKLPLSKQKLPLPDFEMSELEGENDIKKFLRDAEKFIVQSILDKKAEDKDWETLRNEISEEMERRYEDIGEKSDPPHFDPDEKSIFFDLVAPEWTRKQHKKIKRFFEDKFSDEDYKTPVGSGFENYSMTYSPMIPIPFVDRNIIIGDSYLRPSYSDYGPDRGSEDLIELAPDKMSVFLQKVEPYKYGWSNQKKGFEEWLGEEELVFMRQGVLKREGDYFFEFLEKVREGIY